MGITLQFTEISRDGSVVRSQNCHFCSELHFRP